MRTTSECSWKWPHQKHHVPAISATQLLKWLDERTASKFWDLRWSDNKLSFSIDVGIGGNGIEAMPPIHSASGDLVSISLNGTALQWQKRTGRVSLMR